MATPNQVVNGIASYVETELLEHLDGWQLVAGSAAMLLLAQRSDSFIAAVQKSPAASALGLVDDDGNIDVDAAADALKQAIQKTKTPLIIDVPIFGTLTLGAKDIDALRGRIMES